MNMEIQYSLLAALVDEKKANLVKYRRSQGVYLKHFAPSGRRRPLGAKCI